MAPWAWPRGLARLAKLQSQLQALRILGSKYMDEHSAKFPQICYFFSTFSRDNIFLKDFIYLSLEEQGRREKEGERNVDL